MTKPHIYIAIGTFHPLVGGAETQALAHAQRLQESGYGATIITLRHDRHLPRHDMVEGVPVLRVGSLAANRRHLPTPLRKLAYALGLFALGWTLWWHRRRYDLVAVYQLNFLTFPAALACLVGKKPAVITVCSASSPRPNGGAVTHSSALSQVDGDGLKASLARGNREASDVEVLGKLGSPVRSLLVRLLRRIHAVIVVLSSRMEREVAAIASNLPIVRIPNGVDIVRFSPGDRSARSSDLSKTVVAVTRLAYSKGVDVLLAAWKLVHEQEPAAKLIIVGDGPLEDQLKRVATDYGLDGSVEFAGFHTDVPAQLRRGAIGALASRWEGLPNAVLEAMASGLACVATRVSGSEDVIQDGVNGLLVEPEDVHGLACALLTVIQNPDLATQYGRAARETAERRYSLERNTDDYLNLYARLLQDKPTHTADSAP